eukprot:TRINITY_DN1633_c0_g1_i1.p1 TRINITY_DN1633_c0_g1~~TRINITY_DN1633_c0_g1_i1.p1  ORF type:complete len:184 (+),score=8.56 TRINITY_DN1633_c0_g1_i1:432-983(+)
MKPRVISSYSPRFREVYATNRCLYAVSKGGGLFSYGQNQFGLLGRPMRGNTDESKIAGFMVQPKAFLSGVVGGGVAAGPTHVWVRTNNGVYSWGTNKAFELGRETEGENGPTITRVPGLASEDIENIWCGKETTYILTKTGHLRVCGNNSQNGFRVWGVDSDGGPFRTNRRDNVEDIRVATIP